MTDQNTTAETKHQKLGWGTIATCILIVIGVVISIISYFSYCDNDTLIEWWRPWLVCLPIAGLIGALFFAFAYESGKGIVAPLIQSLIVTFLLLPVILGCFYALNYYFSSSESARDVEAPIEYKYSQFEGRRGRKSKLVHCIGIEMPNGMQKKFDIPKEAYESLNEGDKVVAVVEDGLFGVPVIKDLKFGNN